MVFTDDQSIKQFHGCKNGQWLWTDCELTVKSPSKPIASLDCHRIWILKVNPTMEDRWTCNAEAERSTRNAKGCTTNDQRYAINGVQSDHSSTLVLRPVRRDGGFLKTLITELELIRTYYPAATNGKILYQNRLMMYSIELPWKNNHTRVSCIRIKLALKLIDVQLLEDKYKSFTELRLTEPLLIANKKMRIYSYASIAADLI